MVIMKRQTVVENIKNILFRIQIADPDYKKAFEDELIAFKDRIRRRALEKIEEQLQEARREEEEERKARLGPGGLDPVEVFESLPDVSFVKQNPDVKLSFSIMVPTRSNESKLWKNVNLEAVTYFWIAFRDCEKLYKLNPYFGTFFFSRF